MDPSCAENRLTAEEREFFQKNGYLVIENALDPETNQRLIEVLDRVDARERPHPESARRFRELFFGR